MKAGVAAFNQEKALVGAFSVITNLRMELFEALLQVGRWLEQHPAVERVRHPGLPSHPQHELVRRQCYGHSGMMSFYLRGGLSESKKFLSALKVVIWIL